MSPSLRAGAILHDQVPSFNTVVEHVCPFQSVTFIIDPASPVPEKRGVVSFVELPVTGPIRTGVAGELVSICISDTEISVLVFHAASVIVASTS